MPVMKKADALAMVRSNRMPFTKYETSELNVKRFADSAFVTGRLQRERTMNGKNVTDDWRFTKVYVMSQGQWRVIALARLARRPVKAKLLPCTSE